MSGPEQDAFMRMVADLEKAGRIEALRENRDHIHMLAFPDGRRPPEALVAEALGVVRPGSRAASRAKSPSAAARAAKAPARAKASTRRTGTTAKAPARRTRSRSN
jgi:hypothetical protein